MPKPTPQHVRADPLGGVLFSAEVGGRSRAAFITADALDYLFPHVPKLKDRIRQIEERSYFVDLIAERVKTGDDAEPITINTVILRARELGKEE